MSAQRVKTVAATVLAGTCLTIASTTFAVPVDAIDQCVMDMLTSSDTPGAQVAVVIDGELAYGAGYGTTRRSNGRAVDRETIFRMGSIEKMMTAAAVMRQVEAGTVDLDDPLSRTVPEYRLPGPWSADEITVRHLLSHLSGVPDGSGPAELTGETALAEWASLDHPRLFSPPGTFFNYSNLGYTLAGLVAERASGIPFHQYLESVLWQPAGMHHCSHDPVEVEAAGNFAFGHMPRLGPGGEEVISPSQYFVWVDAPNGEAFATADDLAAWAILMLDEGDGILTPASVASMNESTVPVLGFADTHYGLGVMSRYQGDLLLNGHGGAVAGYQAGLWWSREHRFAVAIMVNSWTFQVSTAASCIVDAVLAPQPVDPPSGVTDPASWARYEGRYDAYDNEGEAMTIDVALHGDELLVTVSDPEMDDPPFTLPMEQLYLDTFAVDLDGDGLFDLDATFFTGVPGQPHRQWIVNRFFVGERRVGDAETPAAPHD